MSLIDDLKEYLPYIRGVLPKQSVEFAIQEIERLRAENERLLEANRWIPVSERLPEVDGEKYLVLTKYSRDGIFEEVVDLSYFYAENIEGLEFQGDPYVTHWRYKPPPPTD